MKPRQELRQRQGCTLLYLPAESVFSFQNELLAGFDFKDRVELVTENIAEFLRVSLDSLHRSTPQLTISNALPITRRDGGLVDEVFRYLPMSGEPDVWLAHVPDHVFEAFESHPLAGALRVLCCRIHAARDALVHEVEMSQEHLFDLFRARQRRLAIPAVIVVEIVRH